MPEIIKNFEKTVLAVAKKLEKCNYAIRGTASLVLQGYDMGVDDIDIIADKDSSYSFNELLMDYVIEPVEWKESEKFKSYYGKFDVEGVQVEIMGEFQIKDNKGDWGEPYDVNQRVSVELDGVEVFVTPVEMELSMFARMGRWNAFHRLKRQVKEEKGCASGSDQQKLL